MSKRYIRQPKSSIKQLQAELSAQHNGYSRERSAARRVVGYGIGRVLLDTTIAMRAAEVTSDILESSRAASPTKLEFSPSAHAIQYVKASLVEEYLAASGLVSGNGSEYDAARLLGTIGRRLASNESIHDKPVTLRFLGIKTKSIDGHHQSLVQIWAAGQRNKDDYDELIENRRRIMFERSAVQRMLGMAGVPTPPVIGIAKIRAEGGAYNDIKSRLREFGEQFVGQEITVGPLQVLPVEQVD